MRFDSFRSREGGVVSRLDLFDPRARVVCALFMAFVVASLSSFASLAVVAVAPASVVGFVCFRAAGGGRAALGRSLSAVNCMGLMVCLLLPLAYPGERVWGVLSRDGLTLALMIFCKLNLIAMLVLPMVVSLGTMRVASVLETFRVPEKLRALLILTLRCILLLSERVAVMTRAVTLRAPQLKGLAACRAFACMTGTTLIHASDRAERGVLALKIRGGLRGFRQAGSALRWRARDAAFCLFFAADALLAVWIGR